MAFSVPVLAANQESIQKQPKVIYMTEEELAETRDEMERVTSAEVQEMKSLSSQIITPMATPSVVLGTDKTITGASVGRVYVSDVSPHTIGSWGTSSNGWLDCRTEYNSPGHTGSGNSWGYLGTYISVAKNPNSSLTSKQAKIIFTGSYKGQLQSTASPVGTNSYVYISAQVYDTTNGGFSLVSEKKIREAAYTFTLLPTDISGTIGSSNSLTCTLKTGHTYLLRVRLYTKAEAQALTGDFWGRSDFHSNGADGEGLDYTSVKVDWI